MIKVLIVEDDPMVAEFNKRYLDEIEGFELGGIAHSVDEAFEHINSNEIDLVLLDVYMPGRNGMELLNEIREQEKQIDVILITAASDVENVQNALRNGAVDYLIKPFEFERFSQSLTLYREKHHFLNRQSNIRQEDLDRRILSNDQSKMTDAGTLTLPKGLTKSTLQIIVDTIKNMEKSEFSTELLAEKTNISRVSVRKYLRFLSEIQVLEETTNYGIGRPVYLYKFLESNAFILKGYL